MKHIRNLIYHEDPQTLHVGCETPHAYFIPFHSGFAAASGNRAESDRFRTLCGEWDFRFYRSVSEVEDFLDADWSAEGMERMTVPMCWQMALGRGYDTPHYTNTRYPIPFDPPHVPNDTPCGLYHRTVCIEGEFLREREVDLVFEGVDSCFYLYVNGRFAAYSQVSHTVSEVNVSAYLHEGINDIKVLVLKWCDGTYLEDQDKIRLSGIFREVYLLSRDRIHLTDLYVRSAVADGFMSASVCALLTLNGESTAVYSLLDPCGAELESGSLNVRGSASLTFGIDAPALWSDETPSLYTLCLQIGDEYIRQEFGIRRFEIKDGVIYVNGKKVKGKGVNRHDSHPLLGYATPMDHMLEDLMILKRCNVNMIRTSHYPNDPRFPGLCDRYGFYLCAEADIETHGAQSAGNWDALTNHPAWTKAYLDRAERLMERDKNHPSILFWSVGNESGVGINFIAIADYFHKRMPGCIVHCEDISRRYTFLPDKNEKYDDEFRDKLMDCIDIHSTMYPEYEDADAYFRSHWKKKPYFMCEYSHSMGNSPADLEQYRNRIYRDDRFFGGCVWEMVNHSVDIGFPGPSKYVYGGDFGNRMTDYNFCIDGLLYPDRRLTPGMLELREVLRPVRLISINPEKGWIFLRNFRYFRSSDDLDLVWTIERNGKVIRQGRVSPLTILPQRTKRIALGEGIFDGLEGFCTLNLSYRRNTAEAWGPAGEEIAFDQSELASGQETREKPRRAFAPLKVEETEESITVTDGDRRYTIDKRHGVIASICADGKELLASPIVPAVWRAPTDNDAAFRGEWISYGYDRQQIRCGGCGVVRSETHIAEVSSALTLSCAARDPALQMKVTYRFESGDGVTVRTEAVRNLRFPCLPRFGFTFKMPSDCEYLRYFGRGPVGSYQDMRNASRLGLFSSTVTNHFEHFIRPQENMAHADTRFTEISNAAGQSLLVTNTEETPSFSFNCSHFTPERLTAAAHDYELTPLAETVVHVDWKQSGLGSTPGSRPAMDKAYLILDEHIVFAFRLLPSRKNDLCPFDRTVGQRQATENAERKSVK